MSAFMVDREHIDVLVAVAVEGPRGLAVCPDHAWHAPTWLIDEQENPTLTGAVMRAEHLTADLIGEMLLAENVRSIRARYPDTIDDPEGMPGPIEQYWNEPYTWTRQPYRLTAVEALAALGCYEYQACEHPDYSRSQAARFADALRHNLIRQLPGMNEAPWLWSAEVIAKARASQLVGSS